MTVKAVEETKVEEETNAEAETVTTTIMKGKKVDAEEKDSSNSHVNIFTRMVSAQTAVLNASPKEPGTKTPPPLITCREAAP